MLPADDRTVQGALGGIVVKWNARVRDNACQTGPALQHVADGLAEIAARKAHLFGRPRPYSIEDRLRSVATQLLPPHSRCARPPIQRPGRDALRRRDGAETILSAAALPGRNG